MTLEELIIKLEQLEVLGTEDAPVKVSLDDEEVLEVDVKYVELNNNNLIIHI